MEKTGYSISAEPWEFTEVYHSLWNLFSIKSLIKFNIMASD